MANEKCEKCGGTGELKNFDSMIGEDYAETCLCSEDSTLISFNISQKIHQFRVICPVCAVLHQYDGIHLNGDPIYCKQCDTSFFIEFYSKITPLELECSFVLDSLGKAVERS